MTHKIKIHGVSSQSDSILQSHNLEALCYNQEGHGFDFR
jgi:hypothetical protein